MSEEINYKRGDRVHHRGKPGEVVQVREPALTGYPIYIGEKAIDTYTMCNVLVQLDGWEKLLWVHHIELRHIPARRGMA